MKVNRLLIFLALPAVFLLSPLYALATLTLGYYNDGPLISDKHQAEQLAAYLADHLDTEITVKRTAHDVALLKALDTGQIDMAVLPNYLLTATKVGKPLSTPITLDNHRNFKLYLLVDKKNQTKKINNFQHKTLAILKNDQRVVDLFIRNLTRKQTASFFKKIARTATITETAAMVRDNKAEVACLSSSSLEILKKLNPGLARQLKIIKDSPSYPNHPFVVNNAINPKLQEKIFAALAGMRRDYAAAQILMRLEIRGFEPPVTATNAYPRFHRLVTIPDKKKKNDASTGKETIQAEKKKITVHLSSSDKTAAPAKKPEVKPKENTPQIARPVPKDKPVPEIKKELTPGPAPKTEPKITTPPASELIPPPVSGSPESFKADYDFFARLTETEPGTEPETEPDNSAAGEKKAPTITEDDWNTALQIPPPATKISWLMIIIKAIFALLILSLAGYLFIFLRTRLGDRITVVLLQTAGRLHIIRCRIKKKTVQVEKYLNTAYEKESELTLERMLDDVGFNRNKEELVTIMSSPKVIFLQIVLPILKNEEIASALPWQIKEKKIKYSPEDDKLQFAVRLSDKKKNEMIIDVLIFPEKEYEKEWQALPVRASRIMNLECSLFHNFCCAIGNFSPQDIAFVYQVDAEQAVIFLLGGKEGIISRRLFTSAGFETDEHESSAIELWWPGFLRDMEHTFRYYQQQNNRPITSLYLAGWGTEQVDSYKDELAEKLEVEVNGLNLLEGIKLNNFNNEERGWIELMSGAASCK